VVSWPCALLVQELLIAKRDLKLSRVLKRLSQCEVLLIDDIGYVQQSREEMQGQSVFHNAQELEEFAGAIAEIAESGGDFFAAGET
jgi:flagellar biosynthesis GTPase FlhF